jgi:DNA-binding NtrC family response regulator
MPKQGTKARIVLFGLEDTLGSELHDVLANQHQSVHSEPFRTAPECLGVVEQLGADVIFCSSDRERYLALLEVIGRQKPDLPVVIVSRNPEVSEWLDAIEAGASDYCAAPFESNHIQWILDSALKHHSAPALYRTAGG